VHWNEVESFFFRPFNFPDFVFSFKPYALSQHPRCWKDTHAPCGTTVDVDLHEDFLSGPEALKLLEQRQSIDAINGVRDAPPHSLYDMCDCHFVPRGEGRPVKLGR
jgi:hypothetical protein